METKYVAVDTHGSLHSPNWDFELVSDPSEGHELEAACEVEIQALATFVKEQGFCPAITIIERAYELDDCEDETVPVMVAASQEEIEIEDYYEI